MTTLTGSASAHALAATMTTVPATGALKLSWLLLVFPLFGAVVLLTLEEALPLAIRTLATPLFGDVAVRMGEYWQILLGPLFLLVVLFARGGIDGLLAGSRRD